MSHKFQMYHRTFVISSTSSWQRGIWQNRATYKEVGTKQRQTYWLAYDQVTLNVWLLKIIFLRLFCFSVSWLTSWTPTLSLDRRQTAVQSPSPWSLSKWFCWIARWQKIEHLWSHWQRNQDLPDTDDTWLGLFDSSPDPHIRVSCWADFFFLQYFSLSRRPIRWGWFPCCVLLCVFVAASSESTIGNQLDRFRNQLGVPEHQRQDADCQHPHYLASERPRV